MRVIGAALLAELVQSAATPVTLAIAPELARELEPAGINTVLRVAHFLAQGVYETGYLRRLSENLDYSAARICKVWPHLAVRAAELAGDPRALANAAYAGRDGNGCEAGGDGWRFRGRGFFMLTGRNNYAAAAALDDPDRLETPAFAVGSAIAFWNLRGMNAAADADDLARVTLLVNGAHEGITERALLKRRALRLLATIS